MLEIG
jgi:hypothetical protein